MGSRHSFAVLAVMLSVMVNAGTAGAATTTASITVHPRSGPPGTTMRITGSGFVGEGPCHLVGITFRDADGHKFRLGLRAVGSDGTFKKRTPVPDGAALGRGTLTARQFVFNGTTCVLGRPKASRGFTVT